jgi:hypothetical protein
MPATSEIPICILTEKGNMPEESVEALLKEAPVSFLENNEAIFMRLTDPFSTNQVAFIVKKVQYGNDLMVGERERTEKLTASFADIFAGSLGGGTSSARRQTHPKYPRWHHVPYQSPSKSTYPSTVAIPPW